MGKVANCFFIFRKGMKDLANLLELKSKERVLRHDCEGHGDKLACSKAAAMRGSIKAAQKTLSSGQKGRAECGRLKE
jgi:hypothetical protein